MRRDTDHDEWELEQVLEESKQRLLNPQTGREEKAARRELADNIARPGLWDEDDEEIARDFDIRLQREASLSDAPREYRAAFSPFLKSVVAIPPLDQWANVGYNLTTQHVVFFHFRYGGEPLRALLMLKAFALLSPPPRLFTKATADDDETERAQNVGDVVAMVVDDVVACISRASSLFVDALRGRLGSVVDEAVTDAVINAICELLPDLNNVPGVDAASLRKDILDLWTGVEKARLGTPPPGAPKKGIAFEKLEKERETFIQEVMAAIEQLRITDKGNIGTSG